LVALVAPSGNPSASVFTAPALRSREPTLCSGNEKAAYDAPPRLKNSAIVAVTLA